MTFSLAFDAFRRASCFFSCFCSSSTAAWAAEYVVTATNTLQLKVHRNRQNQINDIRAQIQVPIDSPLHETDVV